ncbi:TetR/AcrR family transcriptional regulator [Minwuia sp.]|uniref:TetR/AcrR family transcriptional regulator n=1 Tax=Minwuia sp. TaxID=2493630 RepID=UPI003A925B82
MPRPDLKALRREQILDAFERCIARDGVEGAGLDRVAEEAGLARALIRHNIGNRDAVLAAAVHRFIERSRVEWAETLAGMPRRNGLKTLVGWLFDPAHADPHMVRVSEALIAACTGNRELTAQIRQWLTGFTDALQSAIADHHPDAAEPRVKAVAAGLTGIYFNLDSVTVLGEMPDLRDASREAALLLVAALDG